MGTVDEVKAHAVAHVFDFLGVEIRLGQYFAGCHAVALAQTTLSGAQTIDGVASVNGNTYLMALQTDKTEVGLWVAAAGAWTRSPVLHFNGLRVVPFAGTQANIIWVLNGPARPADIVFGTSQFSAAVGADVTNVLSASRARARAIYADTTGGPLLVYLPNGQTGTPYEGYEARFLDSAPATSWGGTYALTVDGNVNAAGAQVLINNAAQILLNNGNRTDVTMRHNGASYTVRGL